MFYLKDSWKECIWSELEKPYMKNIEAFLDKQIYLKKNIYPDKWNIFKAFNLTDFDDIKVVIIGQDPYHGKWQANWLSFSVCEWIKFPPSLKNIFKELNSDLWLDIPISWDLSSWAKQWVFLLNSILTVEESKPESHSNIWWENFTNEVIKIISKNKSGVIFLLWWKYAEKKEELIDTSKHYILKTSHPSPFSVYRWFSWSKVFSKTNNILKNTWKKEINW